MRETETARQADGQAERGARRRGAGRRNNFGFAPTDAGGILVFGGWNGQGAPPLVPSPFSDPG